METVRHGHVEHSGDCDWNANFAKGTAMLVLFTTSFLIGNLPIKLNKWFNWGGDAKKNTFVKMLLALGGGVLLCTTFIHLLPEVAENFENLDLTAGAKVPFAELLMCSGFFIMYFVEESVNVYLRRKQKLMAINGVRNLSIRPGDLDDKQASNLESQMVKEAKSVPQHDNHADHSHIIMDFSEASTVKAIRGLLVVLALSVHELFEGLAVGLECSSNNVWYMFGAVSAHKLVIAFCIGVELVTSGMKTTLVVIYVFTFAIVSPLGIGLGIVVSNSKHNSADFASVMLQGFASGTLLYIVFFEILQSENKTGLKQFLAVLVGFLIMFAISMFGV